MQLSIFLVLKQRSVWTCPSSCGLPQLVAFIFSLHLLRGFTYRQTRERCVLPTASSAGHSSLYYKGNGHSVRNSFVVTRIDYGNRLLLGLPAYRLDGVQSVLNYAARLVYGRGKYDLFTHLLQDNLHWRRVPERITLNLACWCKTP